MSALLEVRDLHKHYPLNGAGGRRWFRRLGKNDTPSRPSILHAIDGIDFQIAPGESLGLVGESGCGKSTLVRLLARLIDLSRGEIRFDGANIGAIPAQQFSRGPQRRRIQVVFQDAQDSLNPRFTAFDSIADPLRRLTRPPSRNGLRERVQELAGQVGLPPSLVSRFPHQLSGGQKARVNIARAIAVNPELLILDEPTSALDVSVQAVILHLLAELRQRLGMTYLFVSHDLNVVRLLCDRIMVMYLGKLVEIGPAEAVFAQPRHPYTQALLAALPDHTRLGEPQKVRLTGEPRSPIDPDPAVCRFYGRCPQGQDRCREQTPVLETVGPGHAVACHFWG